MCLCTASQGTRRSAPIIGGPNGSCSTVSGFIKRLDYLTFCRYRQITLPSASGGEKMTTSTRDDIKVGELSVRFLLQGEDTAGSVAVFEFDVPAGAKVAAAHSHDGYDETVYGVEGILTWTVEGTPQDIGPGEAIFIPRAAVHHFDNTHDVDAKALAIVTPGILGPDYFREVGAILDATVGGPPDFVAIGEIMR